MQPVIQPADRGQVKILIQLKIQRRGGRQDLRVFLCHRRAVREAALCTVRQGGAFRVLRVLPDRISQVQRFLVDQAHVVKAEGKAFGFRIDFFIIEIPSSVDSRLLCFIAFLLPGSDTFPFRLARIAAEQIPEGHRFRIETVGCVFPFLQVLDGIDHIRIITVRNG